MEETLGAYLSTLRADAGLSLREVETRTGVSNGYLSLLEHDRVKEPSPKSLYALAQCYGAEYLDLMRRAGYPVPPKADTSAAPSVVFRGAERLNDDERREIQDLITFKLRRRRAS